MIGHPWSLLMASGRNSPPYLSHNLYHYEQYNRKGFDIETMAPVLWFSHRYVMQKVWVQEKNIFLTVMVPSPMLLRSIEDSALIYH